MWKVLTVIMAGHITHLSKKHQVLPSNHFGGRLGCTTSDTLHILAHKIKETWHKGKVAVVLFLDIEGAFPNTIPARLVHNLRKRRILSKYVDFIERMLNGRSTTLKYDGHTLEPI